jgi:hypothetical protein
MPMSRWRWVILLTGLLVTLPAAGRTVYQWTDDQGVTHFSDTAPENRDYEKLELEGGVSVSRPDEGAQAAEDGGPTGSPADQNGTRDGDLSEAINLDEARLRVQKLEERVANARRQYQQARQNRIEGENVRLGSERNYVRYLERIKKLKAREAKAQQQLEDLQEQLKQARQRLQELQSQQQGSGP